MKFTNWLERNWDENNIFCPPIDPQKALNFLEKYLLGDDFYIVNPMPTIQANTEIVHEILYKYSKKYRKEYKKWRKRNR